eukprot:403334210
MVYFQNKLLPLFLTLIFLTLQSWQQEQQDDALNIELSQPQQYQQNDYGQLQQDQELPPPKLVFLFLMYKDHNKLSLWSKFFRSVHPALYSIYFHTKEVEEDFVDGKPNSNLMNLKSKNTPIQVPSVHTSEGQIGIYNAMIQLLDYALAYEDLNSVNGIVNPNLKFIFISQSCIPLYEFKQIYLELMNEETMNRSMIPLKNQKNRFPRYNLLKIDIDEDQVTKHSPWLVLSRPHAELYTTKNQEILRLFWAQEQLKQWFPYEIIFATYLKYLNKLDNEVIVDQCVTYQEYIGNGNKMEVKDIVNIGIPLINQAREGDTYGNKKCLFMRKVLEVTSIDQNALIHLFRAPDENIEEELQYQSEIKNKYEKTKKMIDKLPKSELDNGQQQQKKEISYMKKMSQIKQSQAKKKQENLKQSNKKLTMREAAKDKTVKFKFKSEEL